MSLSSRVNETILSMISTLHSKGPSRLPDEIPDQTPIKRSLSSVSSNTSVEEPEVTPVKKFKRDTSFSDVMYIGSPREVRRIRADLLEARNTILALESRIQHGHSVRAEMQILFDNETKASQLQQERDRKSIAELESQLQCIRKREIELKDELSGVRNKFDKYKNQSSLDVEKLEKAYADLNNKLKTEDIDKSGEITTLKRKVDELSILYKAVQEDREAHKQLAENLGKRVTDHNALERQLELKEHALQKAQLRVKELEFASESYLEFQQQAKVQLHKLATYNDLEKEVQKLKEETKKLKNEVHNKLVLEEEVHDLKNRLTTFKEQENKLTALQTAQIQNEMYLEEWRSISRGICETTGTDSALARMMKNTVEHLQRQEINLTSEKVQLESQLSSASHEAKTALAEVEKKKTLLIDLQNCTKQKQNLIHRMQKKLLLVSRERDSYRLQLDSYERDLTVCLNPASSGSPAANQQHTQRDRIESLERIVEGYREMVTKLENDLQNSEPAGQFDTTPIRAEQLNRLQEELNKLKSENEHLRNRKDYLEEQMEEYLIGQDQVVGGKVLHATNNPLSNFLAQRENETEKLQAEVDRLKRKIRNMEEGLEGSKLNISVCPQELKSLQEQIATAEIQTQRLKEYFKCSMQEMRNVIYMLLGYKVDKTANSQYKLTSMYAESEEHVLCFQLNDEGTLNLLENNFSSTLEDMIELHLQHQKSIPVFLSALTMEMFNNHTMGTKTFQMNS